MTNLVREGRFGPCERDEHDECAREWTTDKGNLRYECTCPCHESTQNPGTDAE